MAKACIDVYVKLPTGKNVQFDLMPSDSIRTLCNEIAKREGWDGNRIKIKYQGKVLKKTSTLGYLGVVAETILKAEIVQPQDLTVTVKEGKHAVEVNVSNFDSINDLINNIEKVVDVRNKKITSKSGSRLTRGTSTIDEIGIYNGEVLILSEDTKDLDDSPIANDVTIDDIKASFDAQGKNVEVVFSFDTTGSMYAYLDRVRRNLESTCTRLIADIPNIRIGLIAHGDYCDQSTYVIRMVDLTSNVQELVSFAKDVPSTGGGDTPECYEWVLKKAQNLDWAEDSAKALVVIGDSPPHESVYTDQHINWHDELDILTGMGVKVYGVHAGTSAESKIFYQELADRSGGSYLPLRSFNVITDMFLAVCYNESDENHLDDFVQELENAGEMTSGKKEMFENLKSAAKPEEKKIKQRERKKHNYTWWKNSLSFRKPSYYYDQESDSWSSSDSHSSSTLPSDILCTRVTDVITRKKKSFRNKRGKRSCTVM